MDEALDQDDISLVRDQILGLIDLQGPPQLQADINRDQRIDILDLLILLDRMNAAQ